MYKWIFIFSLLLVSTEAKATEDWAERISNITESAQRKAAEYKNMSLEQAASKIRQELEGMTKEELEDFIARAKVYLKNFDDREKERLISLAQEYLVKAKEAGVALKEFHDSRKSK